jgi:hypothetical protein
MHDGPTDRFEVDVAQRPARWRFETGQQHLDHVWREPARRSHDFPVHRDQLHGAMEQGRREPRQGLTQKSVGFETRRPCLLALVALLRRTGVTVVNEIGALHTRGEVGHCLSRESQGRLGVALLQVGGSPNRQKLDGEVVEAGLCAQSLSLVESGVGADEIPIVDPDQRQ